VRGTIVWILAAVAVLGAGLVPVPQASARAGGFVLGRLSFNHGGVHRFGGTPFVGIRPGPSIALSGGLIVATAGLEPMRHHRRFFGLGLPIAGIGVTYGPYDGPFVDIGAMARPSGTAPVTQDGDRGLAGGCRTETRLIPSEAGGEQPITITWCRKG
jgi:hypothetical protein